MDIKTINLLEKCLDVIDDVNLPESACEDMTRGALVFLSNINKFFQEKINKGENILVSEIYNYLIIYALASFVLRNYGGQYQDDIKLLDQVMQQIDSNWSKRKEETQIVTKAIIEAAEDICDDNNLELEYFFGISAMLAFSFITAFKNLQLPVKSVCFCLTAFGAAVGIALFLLVDLFKHISNLNQVVHVLNVSLDNYRNQQL